jgi:hypothetical protein
MSTFEVVVIVVAVVGILLALTPQFGLGRLTRRIGRSGQAWIDDPDERPVEKRAGEDDRDAPIPRRPLRGRPQ